MLQHLVLTRKRLSAHSLAARARGLRTPELRPLCGVVGAVVALKLMPAAKGLVAAVSVVAHEPAAPEYDSDGEIWIGLEALWRG